MYKMILNCLFKNQSNNSGKYVDFYVYVYFSILGGKRFYIIIFSVNIFKDNLIDKYKFFIRYKMGWVV